MFVESSEPLAVALRQMAGRARLAQTSRRFTAHLICIPPSTPAGSQEGWNKPTPRGL
jgi:hypothetical protein